jgi:hypothetical protein
MCTVSFIPTTKGAIITSNRDENIARQTALPPQHFMHGNRQLVYPVDGKAKGTWFITRNDNSAGVLLNGAFFAHEPGANYRMSRGHILPGIFKQDNSLKALRQFNLHSIENFTLLIYQQGCLHECKWNGKQLFIVQLDNNQPHIYSSVTLYTNEMIRAREEWFQEWLLGNPAPTQEAAMQFHANAGNGNNTYSLKMKRGNGIQTVSTVSALLQEKQYHVFYKDYLRQQSTNISIDRFNQQPTTCLL